MKGPEVPPGTGPSALSEPAGWGSWRPGARPPWPPPPRTPLGSPQSFNGYASQYKFRPIRVEPHQRVRVWVLDVGPSENSAFHIVGTVFDTVYKEGQYLLQPGPGQGGSQVLDLQPAQGGFVEFTFDEPGLYPIVTHKFANVAKGALGLFQAVDVKATTGASH
jgi:hypothetical protein